MAIDLKPYFDNAQKADEEVQRILNEMNAAFNDGTEEGRAKALELRPSLDEAKEKGKAANDLYISMRAAEQHTDGAAKQFVPVEDVSASAAPEAKEMKREDFIALDSPARMKFIKGGGKVID
jgi:hypothetical protein